MWQFLWKSDKKNFVSFFKPFLTNREKIKMKMKKFGKMIVWQFSWKSKKKCFDPSFKNFLTNWDKNEEKKVSKIEINFWILHIKIRLCANFHKNPMKNFWPIFYNIFDSLRQKWRWRWKKLEKWVWFLNFNIKIRLYRTFHKNLKKKISFQNFYLFLPIFNFC